MRELDELIKRIDAALEFQEHETFPDDITTATDKMLWREGQHDTVVALLGEARTALCNGRVERDDLIEKLGVLGQVQDTTAHYAEYLQKKLTACEKASKARGGSS